MKKCLLLILCCLATLQGFSRNDGYIDYLNKPKRISLFGGAGLATSNNYDVGIAAGLDFHMWLRGSAYIGAQVFMQDHSLYFDNEANSARGGRGVAGFTLRHESRYVFVTPKISKLLASRVNFMPWIYVYGGPGFNMGGYDTVRKWNRAGDPSYPGYFDSTIDASANINSMVLRLGFGFAQDVYMGRNFWFTFREDFGFLANGLTKTGDVSNNNPSRTPYSPNKINPGYISLHIGITYIKGKKSK